MLTRLAAVLTLLLAPIAIVGFAPTAPETTVPEGINADEFTVDAVHSTLVYRVRHFDVSWFYGRINKPTGSFSIDPDDLGSSFIKISIDIKEMDAGNESRDRFLLSPDFFNVREYPTATFESNDISRTADGLQAKGTFTMHGVSKTITVPIADWTEKQTDRFGYRGGFECTFTVKRSDYGMDLFVEEKTLGDDVRITVAIEGVRE